MTDFSNLKSHLKIDLDLITYFSNLNPLLHLHLNTFN